MKRYFKLMGMIMVLFGTITIVSCTKEDDPEEIKVTGITLSANKTSLEIKDSVIINATISPSDAANKGINWSSSNTKIATVEKGVVKGVSLGKVIITATTTDGTYKASCEVTVVDKSGKIVVTVNNLNAEDKPIDTTAWVADYCNNELVTIDGLVGVRMAFSKKATLDFPYINALFLAKVTTGDRWYPQYSDNGFIFAENKLIGSVGDWSETKENSNSTIGAYVKQIDLVNLTLTGSIEGFLYNTEDLNNSVEAPRKRIVNASFKDIYLIDNRSAK